MNRDESPMKQSSQRMEKEHHPAWYYPIQGMETLILGTFPPYRKNWDFEFYYPNNQNHFWKVLAKLDGTQLKEIQLQSAVEERKKLMKRLRVGVQNLGKVILRRGTSSADKDIEILEFQDVLGIVNKCPTLKVIHLTGFSDKSSTYRSFIRYLRQCGREHALAEKVEAGFQFSLPGKESVLCTVGNSTSPAARRAGITFEMLVEQFREAMRHSR